MGFFDQNEKPFAVDSELPSATAYDNSHEIQAGEAENADQLHRRLGNRQIQLLAIGGTIGTALFVSIGSALAHAGPGSLFLAYLFYACMLGLVNNCMTEMTVFMPVSGGFVRLAGQWVDEAFGFMAGWNFFIYEALLIPFEITALNSVLTFWRDDIPVWAVCLACIVLYGLINILAVKAYGEAEFWLSGGKVLLIFMLFSFTFITMVGGNPKHDAYGFRYWRKPGAFAEHLDTGALGRFEGFLAALWSASFTVVGPEYISMVAAEAKRPRVYIKNAFKTVYWRFGLFFIVGALAVGIVIPYNDPTLVGILSGKTSGAGTAAASPYVIAMQNLSITGFQNLVNALLVTSIFSAGNSYTYVSTRNLYGLALEGRAPKILRYCTKSGIPLLCFAVVMIFPFLSFLSVSKSSDTVLTWLINLITAGGVINYIVMSVTYIFFYRALKAQGYHRKDLPYTGWFQPYSAWIGAIFMTLVVFCYGYSSFKPWSVKNFFIYYTMLILAPILFIGWKFIKRTKLVAPAEADLVWECPLIDAYEATFVTPPLGFWQEMLQLVSFNRLGKVKGGNDQRVASISSMPEHMRG
ncbi:AAT family amino acid transporter [Teratosphaeria nubilosa]|uniref:AAT family amino acid transporter n=1 Tax=Teratosphaeria nubilosa TaxID=161662 RepID=A0A6G1LG67_9PEZI|nr:AAT family amino acid transporter [Teratosphaeria nubilosa]